MIGKAIGRGTDAQLFFQLLPVPIFETVQAGSGRRCPGVDVAIERLVALTHLLPFTPGKAIAVAPSDQLFGTELLQVLGIDLGQMHKSGWVDGCDPVLRHLGALAQVVVKLQLAGGRRGLDDFMLRVRACLPKDMRGMASISTAHKYKGLEKPAVVILDAVDRSYPLIHPDWPFFRIFGDTPLTLAEDDRRLFYVALTRAVESLVVITDSAAKSPFLDEIAQHRTMAKMPLKSFPPVFEEFNRRLLVKVKNATGKAFVDQGGTYPIKGLLLQCRYQYHGPTKTWEKSIAIEQFNLESIQVEPWALKAMNVEANFYNDADRLLASYKVDSGQWTALFDKWSAMEAQPPRLDLDGLAGDEREH